MSTHAWTPSRTPWAVAQPDPDAEDLAAALNVPPLLGQILHNRGLRDQAGARAFLQPSLGDLHDPALLAGAEQAARRIVAAVAERKPIVIYGDYDVDGMTAVAILHRCISLIGGDVDFYIPHRIDEGYGVHAEAIDALAAGPAELLITVDCGITAGDVLARARDAGMEVVVTDHHLPGDRLPDVEAIVHPRLGEPSYPNADLAGAGVAMKLAWQICREHLGSQRVDRTCKELLLDAVSLAALGTIADVVPLLGENRSLAAHGLRSLAATDHPGLRALIDASGLAGETLDAFDVGFRLAPRLNACGRMGHAALAVELLLGAAPERSAESAAYLTAQNSQRQAVERELYTRAVEMVQHTGQDAEDHRVIVLAGQDWHAGVIGIVASRIVERFARPAVLIALSDDGFGLGSGRSTPGFHMQQAFSACDELLERHGGHAMAGGLRLRAEHVDAFREAINNRAVEAGPAPERPALAVDAEASLPELSLSLVRRLEALAPFGEGNPPPVVAVRDCEVLAPPRRMGRTGRTLGMHLARDGARMRAVGFGMGERVEQLAGVRRVDVAAQPVVNHFRGRSSVELKLLDVHA